MRMDFYAKEKTNMRVLHIAMVDDIDSDREWLAGRLETYLHARHIPYALSAFTSGEEFLSALSEHWFDIVFMDIYMGYITGLDAARALRAKDRDCKLIFLTISEDFMRQGFSLNSAHYLVKPVKDEDFLQAMENCRIRRECQVPYLTVVSNQTSIQVDTLDILYVDIQNRTVCVHTKDGTLPVGRNFSKATEQLLSDKRFLLCNKGLLVNMDFIAALEECDFVLVTGERLPITPRRKKELAAYYHRYTFGSLED